MEKIDDISKNEISGATENVEDVNVEKEPEESTADIFANIKSEFEQKLHAVQENSKKEIEKRDKIIAELISGDKSQEPVESNLDVLINKIVEKRQKQYKY